MPDKASDRRGALLVGQGLQGRSHRREIISTAGQGQLKLPEGAIHLQGQYQEH